MDIPLQLPYPVVLASASPRRQELLKRVIAEFSIAVPNLDESSFSMRDPWATAEALAQAKAVLVQKEFSGGIVIGGDTIVVLSLDGIEYRQLGKPLDAADAFEMLSLLSGRRHEVITGVCVATPDGTELFSVTTEVTFRSLSDSEIRDYITTGEPMDKAGAYAIQGGAAGFVESIDGSLTNVIGLPLEELRLRLERYLAMKKA